MAPGGAKVTENTEYVHINLKLQHSHTIRIKTGKKSIIYKEMYKMVKYPWSPWIQKMDFPTKKYHRLETTSNNFSVIPIDSLVIQNGKALDLKAY